MICSRFIIASLLVLAFFLNTRCQHEPESEDLLSLVNPFIGTGGHGHTYPGASMPFGMVQLSPDTRLEGWDGCSGYHYSDSIIYGFSHTHLSGTGVSDYADVLLMPFSGEINFNNGYGSSPDSGYASRFSHLREKASPGYYQVFLEDPKVNVELSSSPRAGFHKYEFQDSDTANIILDLEHRDALLDAEIEVLNSKSIQGKRISNAWAREQHIYFYIEFETAFEIDSLWHREINGKNRASKAVFQFHFKPNQDREIKIKVGISAVSMEGARKNLQAEIGHWDFAQTRKEAEDAWKSKLDKIKISGDDTDDKTVFYTALYHSLLNPNVYSDIDGSYRGTDLKVHSSKDHIQHTVFSFWDTFRATQPLFTIIETERSNHLINTLLDHYKKGGALPIWELAANYTGCMIGYHAIPVIVDAYIKGINNYDSELALEAMLASAEQDKLGLEYYKDIGFIPSEMESESVSKSLEYAYDDWCIYLMAKALGKDDIAERYRLRSLNYRNLFDPESKFFRAKLNAGWVAPFYPAEVNFHYTEANAWQYSLFAPHDLSGLIELHGGKQSFEQFLDSLFSSSSETSGREQADITGLIGQYAQGNEPSHHMAYLYSYIGKASKTQSRVHQILTELYSNKPDGLSGNEDCGQMSSWYVLSALGFYPVTPGQASFTIGTPLFESAIISLENGKDFKLSCKNYSQENIFISSASLNGKELKKGFLDYEEIMGGGELIFTMSSQANDFWPRILPSSGVSNDHFVSTPYFIANSKTFLDSLEIEIASIDSGAAVYYSLGGSDFEIYKKPLVMHADANIQAYAFLDNNRSAAVSSEYFKIDTKRSIVLDAEYANQYNGGGNNALIDKLRGSSDFRTGSWQGYQDQDLVATVHLGEKTPIKEVSVGCLQDIRSWIWYPKEIQIELSDDGKTFRHVHTIVNDFSIKEQGAFIKDFSARLNLSASYVRIKATNRGPCPDWHLGAGGKSWIFADEIQIN